MIEAGAGHLVFLFSATTQDATGEIVDVMGRGTDSQALLDTVFARHMIGDPRTT